MLTAPLGNVAEQRRFFPRKAVFQMTLTNDWPLVGWRATAGTHDTADRRHPAAACFPSKRLPVGRVVGRAIPSESCGRAIAELPESGSIPLRVPSAPPLPTSDGTAAAAIGQFV